MNNGCQMDKNSVLKWIMGVKWNKYMCVVILLLLFHLINNSKRHNISNTITDGNKTTLEQTGIQDSDDEIIQNKKTLEQTGIQDPDVENIQKIEFHDENFLISSTADLSEDPENGESDLIKDKIFWSELSETFVPKGKSFKESMKIVKEIRSNEVITFRRSSKEMCGDFRNAIVGLADGTIVCVRYTRNLVMVYAEVLAFYLSRLLQMDNVPEAVLSKINSSAAIWKHVNVSLLSWKDNDIVVMTRQIPDVRSGTFIPQVIKEAYFQGRTVSRNMFRSTKILNPADVADVIQWGTLIIFDSLIGNFDGLHYWTVFGFRDQLHNSLKSSNGKIWQVDHEKSIFYVFKSSYQPKYNFKGLFNDHDKMLKTMCIFQSSVVHGLRALSVQSSPFETLWNYTRSYEPLLEMKMDDDSFEIVANLFKKRLAQIMQWIQHCKALHI